MRAELRKLLVLGGMFLLCGCNRKPPVVEDRYLVRFVDETEEYFQMGVPCGYVNERGDTVIPFGKYYFGYSDTIRTLGIVLTNDLECIGIDRDQNRLFRVHWIDNGPDYTREGLFRIWDNNERMGYADESGKIVIEPRFTFGLPFENGTAKVTDDGYMVPFGEYSFWESDDWYFIDRAGNRVEPELTE